MRAAARQCLIMKKDFIDKLKTEDSVLGSETVEKLRFSDNLCFDFAKHGRPKVPIRKLSPSQSIKTEVHAPGFYEIAARFLFHARCRAAAAAS